MPSMAIPAIAANKSRFIAAPPCRSKRQNAPTSVTELRAPSLPGVRRNVRWLEFVSRFTPLEKVGASGKKQRLEAERTLRLGVALGPPEEIAKARRSLRFRPHPLFD